MTGVIKMKSETKQYYNATKVYFFKVSEYESQQVAKDARDILEKRYMRKGYSVATMWSGGQQEYTLMVRETAMSKALNKLIELRKELPNRTKG